MQKRTLGIALALCLLLGVLMAMPAAAADVITIATADDLLKLMNQEDGYPLDGNYLVTADINLAGKTQQPIGNHPDTNIFTGTFDGNGHTIKGLAINSTANYTGFFGTAGRGATIKNLTLEGSVTSTKNATGGLIGYGRETLTVENCVVNVTVTGVARAAGIIGGYDAYLLDSTLTVANCINNGDITGSSEQPAGIIGRIINERDAANFTLSIIGCVNNGDISGKTYASGILATYSGKKSATVEIKNCINAGAIEGNGYNAGVVGMAKADSGTVAITIEGCMNLSTGTVTGPSFIGGIGGRLETAVATGSIAVTKCHNYAAITSTASTSYVFNGGIAGMVTASNGPITISQCYNDGTVTGHSAKEVCVGGIVGYARSLNVAEIVTVSDCWNNGAVTTASSTNATKYGGMGGIVGGFPNAESAKAALTSVMTDCVNTGTVTAAGTGTTAADVIGLSPNANATALATNYSKSGDTWTDGTGKVVTTLDGLSDSVWDNATTNPTLVHTHVWGVSADDATVHECMICDQASEAHNYVSLGNASDLHICEDCGYAESHAWLAGATAHSCEICSGSAAHSWVDKSADEHECAFCGKTDGHGYADYACEGCGKDQPVIDLTVTKLCVVPGIEYCNLSGKLAGAEVQVDFDEIVVTKDGENWVASNLKLTGSDAEHYVLTSTTFVMTDVPPDYWITIEVENGTASQTEIYKGQSYSVTVTANAPARGEQFAGWLLNDGTEFVSTSSTYTISRVFATDDITLTAVYEPIPGGGAGTGNSSNVALVLALACRNNQKCVVTIKSTGADDHEAITVKKGAVLTLPAAPTKNGYTFIGWFKDINGTKPFDFNTKISGNVSIYAKWVKN
ncbi:MAG: InlB B-repeat-containing protein [Clostridia bacterium]|nr:InlB B-repeat-containing protein [Clostridia bacterium]